MPSLRIATLDGSEAEIDDAELAQLSISMLGPMLRRGDSAYDQARRIFNGMFDRHPALVVRAHGTADVMDTVAFAAKHRLLLAVRGGGHSIPGNSACDGGLMLDLSQMRAVQVDRKAVTVRVQGGATWADVDRETQQFGLAAPGGVVSNTGVAGLSLNGGLGHLRGKYGFSCDNLVSAEVVTASGEVLTASAEENEDLYWALRGGGGNFGVVTEFEFKLHPVGPTVFAAITLYRPEEGAEVLRRWSDWIKDAPDEVSSNGFFWTVPVTPHLPEQAHGKEALIIVGVYAGDAAEGEKVMAPLRTLSPQPIIDMSMALPFRALQQAFDFYFPVDGTVSAYFKSLYFRDLTDEVIDLLCQAAADRASPGSLVNIPHLGRGVRDVPLESTAFAGRGAPFMVSLDAIWPSSEEDGPKVAWSRRWWSALEPHSTGAIYLNFAGDEEGGGAELVRSAFAANYERLVDIKTKYDPANLFRLNQNIRPR